MSGLVVEGQVLCFYVLVVFVFIEGCGFVF